MQDKKQLKDKNSSSSFECHESLALPNNLHIFSMLIHAQSSPLLIPASHLVLLFLSLRETRRGLKPLYKTPIHSFSSCLPKLT